ncbi:MAG: hypothetical protein Q9M23_05510 [Mariprofundaceae bacterium]|nr:hypothetical protein [Mariprofundaceae bacterium]
MKGTTIAGAILIVFGLQGMFYGTFNYAVQNSKTGKEAEAVALHQQQRVVVPLCVGTGVSLVGGLFLLVGARKRKAD